MTDPEIEYRRLVSGDAAAISSLADTLASRARALDGISGDIQGAAVVPVWTGSASDAFRTRVSGLVQGAAVNRAIVGRVHGALETAGTAYTSATDRADFYIGFWRNRPSGLHPVIEELFARVVNARLLAVGTSYNEQLAGISAVLNGDEVDLDELDEETRDWVEEGLEKNDDWLDDNGSSLGPLIPNTAATGDDRGWIPQGLGYDPSTRSLLQAYYNKDGDPSTMAVIDEVTGREITEVELGGELTSDGVIRNVAAPGHVGGVTVEGDNVYITDSGLVYQYSLSQMRDASPGQTVNPTAEPQELAASSYSAIKDGRLYVGSYEKNVMYVYERDSRGTWVPVFRDPDFPLTIGTPDNVQGVLVRNGEFVFSTSSGRHNESSLIVQDRETGERGDPYTLPNMSQGLVEVDGELVSNYESGAEEFSDPIPGTNGWWWGADDHQDLWANPYMTRTPLSELGLTEDIDVAPGTLVAAARDLDRPSTVLATTASIVDGVHVPAHLLGRVPAAGDLSRAVNQLLGVAARSLGVGSEAVTHTASMLVAAVDDYRRTDGTVGVVLGDHEPLR